MKSVLFFLYCLSPIACVSQYETADDKILKVGEMEFRKAIKESESTPCWKEAIAQLNSTCKRLTYMEQCRLAVTLTNCHLWKSGRETYPCDNSMTIEECTKDMSQLAYLTYTKFFIHSHHMCYFLQSNLWQENTGNLINDLSNTSIEVVSKLQMSLDYHKAIAKKQEDLLEGFDTMEDLAHKQRDLLWEVYSSLTGSIDGVRYIMSMFLVELVGVQTLFLAIVVWVFIIFLPQFNYSRCWLNILLLGEQVVEILMRRAHGKMIQHTAHPTPDDMVYLYTWVWYCRYTGFLLGVVLYLWKWYGHISPIQRNLLELQVIRQNIDQLNRRIGGALIQTRDKELAQHSSEDVLRPIEEYIDDDDLEFDGSQALLPERAEDNSSLWSESGTAQNPPGLRRYTSTPVTPRLQMPQISPTRNYSAPITLLCSNIAKPSSYSEHEKEKEVNEEKNLTKDHSTQTKEKEKGRAKRKPDKNSGHRRRDASTSRATANTVSKAVQTTKTPRRRRRRDLSTEVDTSQLIGHQYFLRHSPHYALRPRSKSPAAVPVKDDD